MCVNLDPFLMRYTDDFLKKYILFDIDISKQS